MNEKRTNILDEKQKISARITYLLISKKVRYLAVIFAQNIYDTHDLKPNFAKNAVFRGFLNA